MRRTALALLVVATGLLTLPTPSAADPAQTNFVESQAFGGLTQPTDIGFSPDGRVFIAEKSGLLKVFDNLGDTSATVVADLRTNVYNFWDRGMLGMALDPQFPQRPFVYVLYTHDALIGEAAPRYGTPGATSDPCPNPPGATANGCVVSGRLSRLQLSGNQVVGGEQVLIEDWCQQYPSHSIGALAFGADGALYVTGGDGASFNNVDYGQFGSPRNPCGDPPVPVGGVQSAPSAQGGALRSPDIRTPLDPTTLDGSVLRIDPDTAAGLPDNPLSGSADANARRIVATGLRNPFRLAPRPGTAQLFVGDVGWSSWEEINRIDSAADASVDNFGWPCYEGNGRQGGYDGADLTICEGLYGSPADTKQPLFTYAHGTSVLLGDGCPLGNGSSTAGLAFYQGGAYPAGYDGALFFADYSRKCVWVMFEQGGQMAPSSRQLFARNVDPVNLRIGPGGDLFIVDFAGSIRRISYSSTNQPPTADAQASPTTGPLPLTVNFDGRGSSDPDPGDSLSYAWDLDGDGFYDDSFSAQPSRTYDSPGQVTVGLRVTDSSGESDTDSVVITPSGSPPQATIATPASTLRWTVGDTIQFSGSATDAQDGGLPATALSWALLLQHCTSANDCHTHPVRTWEGVSGGSFEAPDHPYPSHLELRLTATDSSGLTDTETLRLDPRTVDLTFRSEPSGLNLAVGSTEATTPFTRTVIVGSTNSVSAPSPQSLGSTAYRFVSWSDGGARVHDLVAPSSAATYTANYEVVPGPSGLVAAFGFNEGAGVSVGDASPEGNVGSVSGASWSVAGRFGGALSFDGVNDWVTVPDDPSLDMSGALTVEAWVRPTALSGYRTVALKEHAPNRFAYALYGSDGARPSGEVWTGSFFTATGPALAPNAWRHLAVTYSQGSLRLYVDGVLGSSTIVSGALPNASGPLRIGGNAVWSGEFFAGLIDEVRVYNRALTAAEIQTDMNVAVSSDNVAPGAPPNLTASGGLGQVALDWDAASDNVGVAAYNVHRSTSAGFTPAPANRVAVVSSGTAYTDSGLAAGDYFYRVTAQDAAGNVGPPSSEVRGTAAADTEPPSVALSAPAQGARVSGTIDVRANASDNGSLAGVQFLLDGQPLGAEDTSAPYERSWDTTTVANGAHQLSARARDAAGNQRTSTAVGVTVANTASFQNEILATGFDLPTTIEFLPDGRMLVGELQGRIKVLPPPYTQADPGLFLQITNIGSAGVQQGIYDIALDPAFGINHFYYVFYTLGSPNHDRVSRFTANATLSGTVPGSEFVLYEDPGDSHAEHHGGSLNFANDGTLLFTTGEHFNPSLSPLLTSPRGKVHRINRDGTVPADNPFHDGAGPNIDTIWARGLRNPFRAYYDAPTGRYFIADVGGNDHATAEEEINLGVRGANYGWPNSEGPCSAPCTSPLHFYGHNGRDASITGGFVYHGTAFPSSYRGAYFYADYAQNWIRGLTLNADGSVSGTFNFEPPNGSVDGPYGDIVYLTEGPDGALYYVDLGYSDIGGTFGVSKIRRIRYVNSNQPPVASASASPTSGPTPLNVAFSSSGSSDPEGEPLTYSWTFGDGATSTQANPSHTYATAGTYQARLEVSDGVNSSLSAPISISAGSVPTATILSPTDGTQFKAGDVIAYSGEGTDPDDGSLPASAFTWNIDFLHDGHVHPGTPISGVKSGSVTIPSSGHDFAGNTRYRITLTVRDSSGLSSVKTVIVQPTKVDLTFDTTPAGRTLHLDGIAKATPFVYDTLVGFNHTVEARNQTAGSTSYTFASWSDGGAQQHTITVPPAPQTYRATFTTSTLPTGLVGAWGMNEGVGSITSDSSGSGNHGTLAGAGATWNPTGRNGGALSFNGSSGNVTVPDSASLDLNSSYTLEAWVRPTALSSYQTILIKEVTSGAGYWLQTVGSNISSGFNSGHEHRSSSPAIPLNQWSHLAAVFNDAANTYTLYLNGAVIRTATESNSPTPNSQGLVFGQSGCASCGNERWNGLVDDVRIYTRPLSTAEIQADMNSGL